MNAAEAVKVLTGEYARARVTAQRTATEAMRKPTVEELTGDGLFTVDEAQEWIDEWDEVGELRRWRQRRDRCSALMLAVRALEVVVMMQEQLPGLPFPDFTYDPEQHGDPAAVVAALLAQVKEQEA